MSQLQQKKKKVTSLYTQLKKTEQPADQVKISQELTALCVEVEALLEKQAPSQDNFRWTRQINDIKKTVIQIEKEAIGKKQLAVKKESVNIQNSEKMNKQELSKKIVRSIAYKQLTSKELDYNGEELEKLANKMEANLEIMEEIGKIIVEQGEDLDRIEGNIAKAYQTTKDANEDLQEAADLQTIARLQKIRAGLMGILAAIGWGIVGIPGMIVGLFAGWRAAKKATS